jgi:hypothetical protein
MKINIHYSDGAYSYSKTDNDSPFTINVADDVLSLWDSISKLNEIVQRQLCNLDNEMFEKGYFK